MLRDFSINEFLLVPLDYFLHSHSLILLVFSILTAMCWISCCLKCIVTQTGYEFIWCVHFTMHFDYVFLCELNEDCSQNILCKVQINSDSNCVELFILLRHVSAQKHFNVSDSLMTLVIWRHVFLWQVVQQYFTWYISILRTTENLIQIHLVCQHTWAKRVITILFWYGQKKTSFYIPCFITG